MNVIAWPLNWSKITRAATIPCSHVAEVEEEGGDVLEPLLAAGLAGQHLDRQLQLGLLHSPVYILNLIKGVHRLSAIVRKRFRCLSIKLTQEDDIQ